MKLSKRLKTIASLVSAGSIAADIGTDHGYVPIFLVSEGISPSAYAMDVRTGPLERAAEHVRDCGLEEKITLRLSDGLEKLQPGEADTIIIAGMGGELICRILEEGRHVWESTEHLILSPQSELSAVRHYLEENGFAIVQEKMLKEEGKYYVVMEVGHGRMKFTRPCDYEFGRDLIEKRDPVLAEFLKQEKALFAEILTSLPEQASESTEKRKKELAEKIRWIEEAEHEMQ